MRLACLCATAVFGLFALLQLNDLQQYGTQSWSGWVAGYGLVALVSLISSWRLLPRLLYIVGAAAAIGAAATRMRSIDWESNIFYNESNPAGNETGGLLIVAIWLTVLVWRASRSGDPRP